jgi:hypothetical protein
MIETDFQFLVVRLPPWPGMISRVVYVVAVQHLHAWDVLENKCSGLDSIHYPNVPLEKKIAGIVLISSTSEAESLAGRPARQHIHLAL